jgi:glycosyltransferase involved in cell wall biosynthesis
MRWAGSYSGMNKFFIDVTRLLIRLMQGHIPTGVDRICVAYVQRYGKSARAVLHRGRFGGVLSRRASQELFSLLLEPGDNFFRRAVGLIAKSPPMPLPKHKSAGRFLFNVGHSGLERPGYAQWLVRKKVRPIIMVHDLIPITHPEFCRYGEDKRHVARMKNVLKTAAGIVTNSQATLDTLSRFAVLSGCAMPSTVAALPGGGILSLPPAPRPLAEPYFVMLGTIEPRKNHWMVLQVWRHLIELHGPATPRLIVIGRRGWKCENVVDLLERSSPLRDFVLERSDCLDAELVTYLHHAQALLFPSFAEGCGLPVIEALNLGVPVIASCLPVFLEIAGHVLEYLDPEDVKGWLACIEDYRFPDSPRRTEQLQRMLRIRPPTWQTHFQAVENMLEGL